MLLSPLPALAATRNSIEDGEIGLAASQSRLSRLSVNNSRLLEANSFYGKGR